jgi:hypothetical protein
VTDAIEFASNRLGYGVMRLTGAGMWASFPTARSASHCSDGSFSHPEFVLDAIRDAATGVQRNAAASATV